MRSARFPFSTTFNLIRHDWCFGLFTWKASSFYFLFIVCSCKFSNGVTEPSSKSPQAKSSQSTSTISFLYSPEESLDTLPSPMTLSLSKNDKVYSSKVLPLPPTPPERLEISLTLSGILEKFSAVGEILATYNVSSRSESQKNLFVTEIKDLKKERNTLFLSFQRTCGKKHCFLTAMRVDDSSTLPINLTAPLI